MFITSDELTKRAENMATYMHSLIHPVLGWGMIYRRAEGPIPGFQCAFGLQHNGYPDLVISGTTDVKSQQHIAALNYIVAEMVKDLCIVPKSDYVHVINEILANGNLQNTYRAVIIDTHQFLTGYGLNVKRFYGDMDEASMCFIQLVEVMLNGEFPVESQLNQMLFHTTPYGYKGPIHEPVLLDPIVPRISDRTCENHSA